MDDETLDVLKTVCAAGRAHPAFDQNVNARLENLAKAGLLDTIQAGASTAPRRYYRPTAEARAMVKKLQETGVS